MIDDFQRRTSLRGSATEVILVERQQSPPLPLSLSYSLSLSLTLSYSLLLSLTLSHSLSLSLTLSLEAMRFESVEQIELGNIMELSITGQVLRWARQSNLSGGVSLRKAGWMEYEESQSFDSRQALAREDSSHCVGCDEKRRRGKRNMQCSDERVTKDRRRSDWIRMRSCHAESQQFGEERL